MNYKGIDEKELILKAKSDELAFEYVIDRYKGLVISLARRFYLQGGEIEDLISEGMIGLYKAVKTYDSDNKATFLTYAHLLVSRQMINAVKKGVTDKNAPLNTALPISLFENLSGGTNPEEEVLQKENWQRFDEVLKNTLSKLEYEAMVHYLSGESYKEIAKKLNSTEKAVDNCLTRAKNKLAKDLGK